MFEKALILSLYSITPVHAGSGAEMSVIDLPIQRERHTGFPVVWGQSLKGVLRSYYTKIDDSQNKVKTEVIFGPPTDSASDHAGAISVGDVKVLLFPVRSAKGVFAHVTCPMVLKRFRRDLELANITVNFKIPPLKSENFAAVSLDTILEVQENKIIIEDLALNAEKQNISQIVEAISRISPISLDENRIVIVQDDIFSILVRTTTEILARVRIKAETGTVDEGALWYEEYLPSDVVMYSVIAIAEPRRKTNELSTAEDVAEEFRKFDGKFVQVGGNETIGKGFVKLGAVGNENA